MTHYMELLATNQPWNLIYFMVVPVVLAETVAITELAILFNRETNSYVKELNKYAGLLAGIYFAGVFAYLLFNAVIPLTTTNSWRGLADMIAVSFYLLGVIPLLGIALLEMNLLARNKKAEQKLKLHVFFVALFLIVAHIAMIFGMLNPTILGWQAPISDHMMM